MTEEQRLLTYLEDFITHERKERFTEILSNRTQHFTVAIEDIFQMQRGDSHL